MDSGESCSARRPAIRPTRAGPSSPKAGPISSRSPAGTVAPVDFALPGPGKGGQAGQGAVVQLPQLPLRRRGRRGLLPEGPGLRPAARHRRWPPTRPIPRSTTAPRRFPAERGQGGRAGVPVPVQALGDDRLPDRLGHGRPGAGGHFPQDQDQRRASGTPALPMPPWRPTSAARRGLPQGVPPPSATCSARPWSRRGCGLHSASTLYGTSVAARAQGDELGPTSPPTCWTRSRPS